MANVKGRGRNPERGKFFTNTSTMAMCTAERGGSFGTETRGIQFQGDAGWGVSQRDRTGGGEPGHGR